METDLRSQFVSTADQPQSNGSRRFWKDQRWNSLKDEIHQIYVKEDNTLEITMQRMEGKLGFEAKERTWKNKLKSWNFDKYLSTSDMKFVVAKAEKRSRQGKDTVFFHGDSQVTSERIQNFKKRKTIETSDIASPVPNTPLNVTYHTPQPISSQGSIEAEQSYVSSETIVRSDLANQSTPKQPHIFRDDGDHPDMAREISIDSEDIDLLAGLDTDLTNIYPFQWSSLSSQLNNDTDTDVQFGPECPLDEATSLLIAEDAVEVARACLNADLTPLIADCVPGIVQDVKSKGVDRFPLEFLISLLSVAIRVEKPDYEYPSKPELAVRLAICWCEQEFGTQTLRLNYSGTPRPDHFFRDCARTCHEIIDSCQNDLGCRSLQHMTQHLLGTIFCDIGRVKEVLNLYIKALAGFLKPPLTVSIYSRHMKELLNSLSDFYVKNSNGWGSVRWAITRIQMLLKDGHYRLLDVLFDCVRLAAAYSEGKMFELAEILFQALLIGPHGNYLELSALINYALHLQRQHHWEKSARHLIAAYECLIMLDERDIDQEEILKLHLAVTRDQLGPGGQAFLAERIKDIVAELTRPRLPVTVEGRDDVEEDDATDGRSTKYGVTYSVSEITGISYSQFMVP